MKTASNEQPPFYSIERTHDNLLVVRFSEDITENETEDGIVYQYDETVGEFPWSNSLANSIRRNPNAFLAKLKAIGDN